MKRRTIILAFAGGLAANTAAAAGITVDSTTGLVTCVTPAGQFSQREVAGLAEGNRMSGRIRLVTPAPSARWVPAAGFLFNAPNDRNAGVQIALSPDDANLMLVGLRLPGRPDLIQLGSMPANVWVLLSVSLDPQGTMVVTVGRRVERRHVRLRGPIAPNIHCNSGTFEFVLDAGMRLAAPPAGED